MIRKGGEDVSESVESTFGIEKERR